MTNFTLGPNSYNPGSAFSPSSDFGNRPKPGNTSVTEFHGGLDYSAPAGTPVPAASDGVVAYSGYNAGGYGNVVVVQSIGDDGHGYYTLYAHLDGTNMAPYGSFVGEGSIIGAVGNTGGDYGYHLHFEVLTMSAPLNKGTGGSMGFRSSDPSIRINPNDFSHWDGGLPYQASPKCFLAGTPILMADGTEKPIEEIEPGDEVMAFNGRDTQGLGQLQPKKVTRLFRNVTKSIIDLRGLKMTPGHVVLSDNGDWLTIAEVLRNDRGIVEERKTGAVLVRARTGAVIGSLDDTPIRVHFVDQKTGRQHQAYVRAGIPALGKYLTPNKAEIWTLARILLDEGYTVSPDGWMTLPTGQRFNATPWPSSSPFETEMMLSWVISVDGIPYTPPWIAELREDEEQETVNAGYSQPRSATTFRPANPASGRPLNRAERRRQATFRVVK